MSRQLIANLLRADGGAVAPTIGLSLFALVAAGGLAFDYSRMATLDTELQNAADQAALAAASQLDGKTGTCSRAGQAARTLVANQTRFSNDTGGLAITIANETACDAVGNIRFYQDKAKATPATSDADANFVLVTVDAREAFFALTPVVAAFSSGALAASAYAGLGSAVCKVPPVMMCNPDEPIGNTN
ncbi:MAG: pilus assembly protein TadG-related protein, partial [Sphingomonadaceae bacterium]